MRKMEREAGYKQLLTAYKKLEKENQKLKKKLSAERVSELSILVKDCIKYNRDQLRKVALEFQLTNYDNKNVEEVVMLVEFLRKMCEELSMMTEVQGYGT